MENTQFIIIGPVKDEDQLYWNNELGWLEDLGQATTFPRVIFGETLPYGGSGLMELTIDKDYVGIYTTLSVGGHSL